MTAFTDDLDNDLEVLAEHHDVTPVQVAKTAIALVPEHARHDLIRSLGAALPTPVSEDPLSESTGLPVKLRGVVHELTRNYPANLVVDAAMLEMPQEVREQVARAFLPKRDFREATAVRSQLVVRASGRVLYEQPGEYYGPQSLLITEDDETSARYAADANGVQCGSVEHEIKADGSRVIRTYYRLVVGQ